MTNDWLTQDPVAPESRSTCVSMMLPLSSLSICTENLRSLPLVPQMNHRLSLKLLMAVRASAIFNLRISLIVSSVISRCQEFGTHDLKTASELFKVSHLICCTTHSDVHGECRTDLNLTGFSLVDEAGTEEENVLVESSVFIVYLIPLSTKSLFEFESNTST